MHNDFDYDRTCSEELAKKLGWKELVYESFEVIPGLERTKLREKFTPTYVKAKWQGLDTHNWSDPRATHFGVHAQAKKSGLTYTIGELRLAPAATKRDINTNPDREAMLNMKHEDASPGHLISVEALSIDDEALKQALKGQQAG